MASVYANTNVYPLPTASRRRVVNPRGLALLAASDDLPQHPAKWEDHGGRKAWQEAQFTRSPEMLIVSAMLKVLSEPQKVAVRGYISSLVDFDHAGAGPHAATALAIVEGVN